MATAEQRPELLRYLDQLVVQDPGRPGFSGRVCFGVRTPAGPCWWMAVLDPQSVTTSFPASLPEDFDVAVGFDETQSGVDDPQAEQDGWLVTGDVAMLDRFSQRYLKGGSPLSVRFGLRHS